MASSPNEHQPTEARYQQVARHLRDQIAAGVLRHGTRLPSTRQLAADWNVSVVTIDDAMKVLTEEELIISIPRSHREVNAPNQDREAGRVHSTNPKVVLIGGWPGSGKTELGRILARKTGWPMLDKDTLTRPVVERALELIGSSPHDRESERYLAEMRPREYESLANTIAENVECGTTVVATAPFLKEFSDRTWLNRTVASYQAMDATVHIVWVHCDAETMHFYVRHRGAARDASKLENWENYLKGVDLNFRPPVPHHVVDNGGSSIQTLQDQSERLLDELLR